MTIDRISGRATNQNELVEGARDRIILEHTDLQITVICLENPQEWKGSVCDVENWSTSQDRSVQLRMPSARNATKLDTSKRYANPRKEAQEPI